MKVDVVLTEPFLSEITKLSTIVEKTGFNCLWTSETKHNPFLPLVLAAENTQKIELGTAITVALARSPTVIAYTSWDLAQLSKGRFILGLGTQVRGHIQRRFGMEWNSPIEKLQEMIHAIRSIWNSWQNQTPLNFKGKYFNLNLMTPFFNPGSIENPNIPIYIAGVNQKLCRTAGMLCDGFHIHPLHTQNYIQDFIIPNIKLGAEESNRSVNDVTLSGSAFVITGPDEKSINKQKEFVRSQIAFYASTPSYAKVFELHGWSSVSTELNKLVLLGNFKEMTSLITDEMLETIAIIGEPHEIAHLAMKKYSGLLNRINFYIPFELTASNPLMLAWWKQTINSIQSS